MRQRHSELAEGGGGPLGLAKELVAVIGAVLRTRLTGGGRAGSSESLEYWSLIESEQLSLLESFLGVGLAEDDGSPDALAVRDLLEGGGSVAVSETSLLLRKMLGPWDWEAAGFSWQN